MRSVKGKFLVASFFLFSFVVFLLTAYARGGEPTELVKQTIEEARRIIDNERLTEDQEIEGLRILAEGRFDFEEMSRRSLAGYWNALTPGQKKEFVSFFSKLIEDSYSNRIRRYRKEIREHSKDRVLYFDERINGPYATVKTEIITFSGIVVPVNYKFVRKGSKWLAYDVIAEGVSLINNYRSQFSEILRRGSYEELRNRLKAKALK